MDPKYKPPAIETRQVYGIYLQQRRNDAKIDASLFQNIVSQNKEVRSLAKTSLLTTYSSFAHSASAIRDHRLNRRHSCAQVHAIQQRRVCPPRIHNRARSRSTIPHTLHPTCRHEGGPLVAAPPSARPCAPVQKGGQACREGERDRSVRRGRGTRRG